MVNTSYILEINEWFTWKSMEKMYVFSDFSEVWVFQRWTMLCNTWYFVLLLAFLAHFCLETSKTRETTVLWQGYMHQVWLIQNSLRVLKGLKSPWFTHRFTYRSFQLHITLWLDCNAISYMILIQFAVTELFKHCPSGPFSESSDSVGEASSPNLFLVASLAELINLLIEFNSFRLYMLM